MAKTKTKDGFVQTRVPPDLERWIRTEAKRAGLSVAAWLRGTLIGLRGKHEARFGVRRAAE